jgi:hypothetical protein
MHFLVIFAMHFSLVSYHVCDVWMLWRSMEDTDDLQGCADLQGCDDLQGCACMN